MENFSFWDPQVWGFIDLIAVLMLAFLAAKALKKLIPVLKKSLIPTSVLGGVLLLLFAVLFEAVTGKDMFNTSFFGGSGSGSLEIITYHCLGLGFAATTLKPSKGKFSRQRSIEIFDSGVAVVATYVIQAFFGLGATLIAAWLVKGLFPAAGVILPFGYGQGTGQALNYGIIYETEHGFTGGRSFGLTIAAFGFLSASIGGVIHLNILRKKGCSYKWEYEDEKAEVLSGEDIQQSDEIPMNGSMDKLTSELMLVFTAYLMAYGMVTLLGKLVPSFKSLFFGLNYLLAVVAAIIIRNVNNALMKKGIVKHQHINAFFMTRISGFLFDLMIVSGIAAIKIRLLADYWWVLLILGIGGAFITYFYDYLLSKKLFPDYAEEQFMMLYGMMTGTASTGIILLRQLDPEFKSPAQENMVYLNFPAIAFGFPMMIIAAGAPEAPLRSFFIVIGLFVVLNAILFRTFLFKKKS